MTTLTPHREAAERALQAVRQSMANNPPATADSLRVREMTIGMMESSLLVLADMLDAGCDLPTFKAVIELSFANALRSHCLSVCGDDRETAHGLFHAIVAGIDRNGCLQFAKANPDGFSVKEPIHNHHDAGRA